MTFTQVVLNSIVRASELTLLSLGLTIVYDILKFANFAHTEFAVVGVYLTLLLNVTLGLHIVPAAIIASVIAGLFSIAIDRTVQWYYRNGDIPGNCDCLKKLDKGNMGSRCQKLLGSPTSTDNH